MFPEVKLPKVAVVIEGICRRRMGKETIGPLVDLWLGYCHVRKQKVNWKRSYCVVLYSLSQATTTGLLHDKADVMGPDGARM